MDLIGIENEAEFFPAGTLSDSLQDELREITSRWCEAGDRQEPGRSRLPAAASRILTALRQIRNTSDRPPTRRIRPTTPHHALVQRSATTIERESLHTALEGEPVVPSSPGSRTSKAAMSPGCSRHRSTASRTKLRIRWRCFQHRAVC